MSDINTLVLSGRWARDPELRYSPDGMAFLRGTLVNNIVTGVGDQQRENVSPIRVVMFRKNAENCHKYRGKQGDEIFITNGRFQVRSFEDRDGITRWSHEVLANGIKFGQRPEKNREASADSDSDMSDSKMAALAEGSDVEATIPEDDIPF